MLNKSNNLGFYLDRTVSDLEPLSTQTIKNIDRLLQSLQKRDRCIQSLNGIKPKDIVHVNQLFYIFSKKLPEILSFHIGLSSRLNPNLFADYKAHEVSHSLEECSFLMQESGLMYYSLKSHIDSNNLLAALKTMLKDENSLLKTLINVQNSYLYHIIENLTLINNHSSTQDYFPFRHDDLKRRLAEKLMCIGCSQQLNLKLTGLHHHTIHTIYETSPIKAPFAYLARGKQHKIMFNRSKNMFIMFMLEMYTLSSNILHNRLSGNMPLTYKPREDLNASLACGAYSCASFIYKYSKMNKWKTSNISEVMPYFDEFVKILEEYLEGMAVPVACAKCHTPYLFFKQKASDLDFIYGESKKISCPNCNTHAEYLLYD